MRTITSLAVALALLVSSCGKDGVPPPTGPTTGAIDITSTPSGAAIFLNDEDTGRVTPNAFVELQPGPYEVKLVLQNYEDWVRRVTVKEGATTVMQAILVGIGPLVGAIDVSSTPSGASIFLNGTDTGRLTPSTITDLAPGPYEVKLVLQNYEDWVRRVTVTARVTTRLDAVLTLKCPGDVIGDLALPPTIEIVGLAPGHSTVRGTANNLNARKHRPVGWAKTDIWYVQPFVAWPYTNVCADGSWKMSTHSWTRFVVVLVDSTYVPGATRTSHPSTDRGVLAWDEYPEPSPDRIIGFSGFRWRVKVGGPIGPHDNYFDARNVVLDGNGHLRLKTEFRDDQWTSSEVVGEQALGHGQYTVQFLGRLDDLDFHAVKTFFLYQDDLHEIDFEVSQALARPHNAQFVVQPSSIERFTLPPTDAVTVRIDWQATRIVFSCWHGFADEPTPGTLIHTWTYTGSIPPAGQLRPRFNLWLYQHQTPRHADELIVRSFRFQASA